ncbi:iron uptake transporter permease EfeU [Variovorax sp. LT1R16]|uniref:iron uptake transporter permease EfeU n=1 Tax=Variovorax sp. LT1R16 TaxID=3443728 RepID=UPI003F47F117
MLIPFLIMLREGIEAALIVGIVASYLQHSGRGKLMPAVWVGVLLAAALSLFVGAGLQLLAAEFPQKQQELFEGVVGLIAVVMLTSMVFWMRKAARSIKGQLHASIDRALGQENGGQAWALIGMVFLAVAREGLESVFFLLAIFQQSSGWEAPVGALAGIAVSVVLGYGLYAGGVRLDLRRFFRYTGVFILLVAAGLLAGVLRKLHEGGVWNHLQTVVFDTSEALPMDSPVGAVLSGLLGYQAAPVVGEVIAYLVFLAASLFLFFRPAVPVSGPVAAR